MTDLSNYNDSDLLQLANADFEKELNKRGYKYGWYKPEEFAGAIYILVNPAFPTLVKIGYADDVPKRVKQLNSNSGLPDPYHCYAIYKVKKRLEDLKVHSLIDSLNENLRHAKNREFYDMPKEKAYEILSAIAQINGNEDLLILNPFEDPYFKNNNTTEYPSGIKKPNFNFKLLNIQVGSTLHFKDDPSQTCIVHDDKNHVMYKNEIYSLSALAQKLKNSKYSLQGPAYFTYAGTLLIDIRREVK